MPAGLRVLLLLLFLAGCVSQPPRPPEGPARGDRSIFLVHPQSGERISVVYRRDGRVDPAAMREIEVLFRDRRGDQVAGIAPELIDLLADLRDGLNLPADARIDLLSGYRTPENNAQLAKANKLVAENSYHMRGMAADIRIPGIGSRVVEQTAKSLRRGGVAYYPGTEHVHVDVGPVRIWVVK